MSFAIQVFAVIGVGYVTARVVTYVLISLSRPTIKDGVIDVKAKEVKDDVI